MKIGPCLRLWARGSPAFLSSVSLEDRGGWRADKAHDPGSLCELAWIGPRVRGSRTSPERRALGVKRHAPRLAARQRGIFAFRRLTVVRTGPAPSGRRGCPSTARGQRLRKSFARRCRSRSPPTERLRKTPLEEWIGMAST